MRLFFAPLVLCVAASPALARDKYVVQPIQIGTETVRYVRGDASVSLFKEHGSIQVQPLAFDHGSLSFAIAVYNDGQVPADFDVANIRVTVLGQQTALLSRDALEKKAKNRAMWKQIGIAAIGGLASAAAASQQDRYTATTYTPRGTYRTVYTAPSSAGQAQAVALAAGTGVGIAAVQNQLEQTLSELSTDIVQMTTVDPGDSYGGRIVVSKVKFDKALPARVDLLVSWNGEDYPLAFQVAKPGTPAPAFTTAPAPPNPEPSSSPPTGVATAATVH
ncbi:hypothetical protein LQ953_01950 [Sphingomonas sp. IC-56]|uniref:hypothetical protein n=1 Tax=Sphingomonas sp. IC-56 TaxID=2898529 RepID=UPI001E4C645D|nr:hypothetical protein [Sphingomonas sp. IC-56]MCD2322775.1 hypothetical protein [Sphingomonas sp. IC-56]